VNIRSPKFVLIAVAFVVIGVMVQFGVTDAAEDSIMTTVAAARNPVADVAMIVITTSSDLFPIYFSPIIIFALILIIKKKTRRVGAILLLTLAVATLVTAYVKDIVDRERPTSYEFKPDIGFGYEPQQDVVARSASSFPSGHATRSGAFALIVSFLIRNRTLGGIPAGMLMWIYPALVAFSRMYIGVHYPTDVIAGVLLGILVSNVLSRVLKLEPERILRT
jgi:undecaprenyl-diphosphatase